MAAKNEKESKRYKEWYARNRDAQRERSRVRHKANRVEETKKHATYYESHKEQIQAQRRDADFKRKYGISLAERDAMLEAQGGRCAICQTDAPGPRGLFVDHCHETGRVRGLLCHKCNYAVALLCDDPGRCRRAATYLSVVL